MGVICFWALAILFTQHLLRSKPFPSFYLEDFSYYEAGFWKALRGGDPYDIRRLGPAFIYPPPSLIPLGLLAALPWSALAVILPVIDIGCLWLVTTAFARDCSKRDKILIFAAGLAFCPFVKSTYIGQVNCIVAALMAASFLSLSDTRRKRWWGGFLLGIAAQLKVTPVVLFLPFVVVTRKRGLQGLLLSLFVLCLASGLIFGFKHFVTYAHVFRDLSQNFPLGHLKYSVVAASSMLFHATGAAFLRDPGSVQQVYLLFWGTLFLLTVWRRGKQAIASIFALGGILLTILPNVVWYHHLVLLWGPLIFLASSSHFPTSLRTAAGANLLLVQLATFLPPNTQALAVQGTTNGVAVMLVWQIWARRRVEGLAGETDVFGGVSTDAGALATALPGAHPVRHPTGSHPD